MDDEDFATVSGIQVFTANRNVIAAAKDQRKLGRVVRGSQYPYVFLGGGLWFVNIVDYLPCVRITKYALGFCCFPILSALCHL